LADDNSTLQLIDEPGVTGIKEILEDFSIFSGLKCNYEKTVIMPFLDNIDADSQRIIENSGFRVVDSVELLGMKISKNLDSVNENFVRAKNKIVKQINFWERFRLSLPGRIAIAKTFMIPQVNYIGCVFVPENLILSNIQNLIDGFVKKNCSISKERLYADPRLGGVGMFELGTFLDAQRFSWMVRSHKLTIDNWRYDLRAFSPAHDFFSIRNCDIDQQRNPVLAGIVASYCKILPFLSKKNLWSSQLFDNDVFIMPGGNVPLNNKFFSREMNNNTRARLRTLTLKECFNENAVKSIFEFANLGVTLTQAKYLNLAGAVLQWKQKA
jgi:hypothetical protein